MRFLIGEGGISYLERLAYRGVIGIFYESTFAGMLAFLIFGIICILAFIGLITVIKTMIFGFPQKNKKNDYHYFK